MYAVPDHHHSLSLRLSKVLSDIGVNEKIVTERRKMRLLCEGIENTANAVHQRIATTHYFGSQTEGTTTVGLMSDTDQLVVRDTFTVIQDMSEWDPLKKQLLMLQNNTTAPGYCLLQQLESIIPSPQLLFQGIDSSLLSTEGMFLKNSSLYLSADDTHVCRRGPSIILTDSDHDLVFALACSFWPMEALPWIQSRSPHGWPTAEMKSYSAVKKCYVVPVASSTSLYPELEWRISTSHAERCLIFSLNITQIKCYILMKMIIKNYVEPKCHGVITSFILKNVLFHCIAGSHVSFWVERNLVMCLSQCLQRLFNCILNENCPHFIIPSNNLIQEKMTTRIKQQLVAEMCSFTENIEQTLLGISVDNLGDSLKLSGMLSGTGFAATDTEDCVINELNGAVASSLCWSLDVTHQWLSNYSSIDVCHVLSEKLFGLLRIYSVNGWLYRTACKLYAPFFCTILGSALASEDIKHSRPLSQIALGWFTFGLNSDLATSRLKLASTLLCSGNLERCEIILRSLDTRVNGSSFKYFSFCSCDATSIRLEQDGLCCERREKTIRSGASLVLSYLPFEKHSAPEELVYEMFSCNQDDLSGKVTLGDQGHRVEVDSQPYFYFLKYKVYRQLQRLADQLAALEDLSGTIHAEDQILQHRETAYNLLGQCLEKENKYQEALDCYNKSIDLKPENNVAYWHIYRQLEKITVDVRFVEKDNFTCNKL